MPKIARRRGELAVDETCFRGSKKRVHRPQPAGAGAMEDERHDPSVLSILLKLKGVVTCRTLRRRKNKAEVCAVREATWLFP